jgi:carbonic anhydrase
MCRVNRQPTTAALGGARPIDLVYRYEPGSGSAPPPTTAAQARSRLRKGNLNLVRFIKACQAGTDVGPKPLPVRLDPHEVGQGEDAAGFPKQEPFALVLGCADARTPAEITFCQSFNDIFNIRVAGNVLGVECAGSVRYALDHFAPSSRVDAGNPGSLKLMISLGHRNCGAVRAAVDAYQSDLPPDLLPDSSVVAILNRISFPSLTTAVEAFDDIRAFGPCASRDGRNAAALTDLVVDLNAAWAARELRDLIPRDPLTQQSVEVVYGVFDPRDCSVSVRTPGPRMSARADGTFASPPRDLKDLRELAGRVVGKLRGGDPSPFA